MYKPRKDFSANQRNVCVMNYTRDELYMCVMNYTRDELYMCVMNYTQWRDSNFLRTGSLTPGLTNNRSLRGLPKQVKV